MADIKQIEELQFDNTVTKDSKGSVILGKLTGPCADFISPTRNGRKYSEELWEKVFNDPIVKEYFECGGIFGELGHPADREETDMEKIALCMPKPPVKDKDGHLIATFDILDTPNGRILKTLCQYGYKMGISSRGSGDVITDYNGEEAVNPQTYQFNAFDAVLLPAVKEARLSFTENLKRNLTFKQALSESLDNATDAERKIMQETINNLNLDIKDNEVNDNKDINDESLNIDEVTEERAVDNNEAVLEELQSTLLQKSELESKVISLQEKLSVCYAKESVLEEQIQKQKSSISKLVNVSTQNTALQKEISSLKEELEDRDRLIEQQKKQVVRLQEKVTDSTKAKTSLSENLNAKRSELDSLKEQVNKERLENTNEIKSLEKAVETLKEELTKKSSTYSKKLEQSNALVEKYKNIASRAVDKYIDSQAIKIGVSSNEVKNKLPESYSFKDIDEAVESLQQYKLNMSKLPFNSSLTENIKVSMSPSKNESILPANSSSDDIDIQLLRLAGLD